MFVLIWKIIYISNKIICFRITQPSWYKNETFARIIEFETTLLERQEANSPFDIRRAMCFDYLIYQNGVIDVYNRGSSY